MADFYFYFVGQPEDVMSLLSIKLVVKSAQLREVESMRAIARDRNLADLEETLKDYKAGEPSPHSVPSFDLADH